MAMAIAVGISAVEMRERRGKSDGQDADAWMYVNYIVHIEAVQNTDTSTERTYPR